MIQSPAAHFFTRWAAFLFPAIGALLAFGFRVAPVRSHVFPQDAPVRLLDGDSYFHVRQISSILLDFPHISRIDRFERFPREVRGDGAGLFDVAAASVVRLLAGESPSREQLLKITPWIAPVLGVLAVLVLFALARRWMDPWPAAWCCLAYVCWPGTSMPVTLLGYVDHHAAEILLSLLMLVGLSGGLRGTDQALSPRRVAAALLASAPLVIFLFTWVGAGLHVAALGAALFPVLLVKIHHGNHPGGTARAAFLYAASAGLVSLLVTSITPDLVISPAALRLALVGLVVIALYPSLLVSLAGRAREHGISPGQVTTTVILVTLAGTALLVASEPGSRLYHGLLSQKSTLVAENSPVTLARLSQECGPLALLALLAWPLALRRSLSSAGDPRKDPLLEATIAAIWIGLWARTGDYGYVAAPFIAFLSGLTVQWLVADRDFGPPGSPGSRRRFALVALLVGVLILPLLSDRFRRPWATPDLLGALTLTDPAWDEAMDWMRNETPAPYSPSDPIRPTYGVLGQWEMGNLLAFLGERPAAWSRYPTEEDARWLTLTDEREAMGFYEGMCPRPQRARYVVINARAVAEHFMTAVLSAGRSMAPYIESGGSFEHSGRTYSPATYGAPYQEAISVRMYRHDGANLEHHRLVFETSRRTRHFYRWVDTRVMRVTESLPEGAGAGASVTAEDAGRIVEKESGALEYDESIHPSIKIFEIVRGARCRGKALPGTEVVATLPLEVEGSGRRFRYETRVRTRDDGTYKLILPYPTLDRPPASRVKALEPYRLEVIGLGAVRLESGSVAITEAQVQKAGEVTPRMEPIP